MGLCYIHPSIHPPTHPSARSSSSFVIIYKVAGVWKPGPGRRSRKGASPVQDKLTLVYPPPPQKKRGGGGSTPLPLGLEAEKRVVHRGESQRACGFQYLVWRADLDPPSPLTHPPGLRKRERATPSNGERTIEWERAASKDPSSVRMDEPPLPTQTEGVEEKENPGRGKYKGGSLLAFPLFPSQVIVGFFLFLFLFLFLSGRGHVMRAYDKKGGRERAAVWSSGQAWAWTRMARIELLGLWSVGLLAGLLACWLACWLFAALLAFCCLVCSGLFVLWHTPSQSQRTL